jgi:hypothetical protein
MAVIPEHGTGEIQRVSADENGRFTGFVPRGIV